MAIFNIIKLGTYVHNLIKNKQNNKILKMMKISKNHEKLTLLKDVKTSMFVEISL